MRVAVRVFDGLRTLLVGAVLGVAVQGTATSRLEGQQERRWGGPEIGLNLTLGLGRGRFHDFVKAAGGFGAYGTLPIALRGGLALRAELSVLFHDFETWSSFPDITTKSYITSLRAGPQVAVSAGRVQLYGFGAGGFSSFATGAAVEPRARSRVPRAAQRRGDLRHGGRGHAECGWLVYDSPPSHRSTPARDSPGCQRVGALARGRRAVSPPTLAVL